MARYSVLCGVVAMCLTAVCHSHVVAGETAERRGEIGIQAGVRIGEVGWAFDFGSRLKAAGSTPAGYDPSSTAIAEASGR